MAAWGCPITPQQSGLTDGNWQSPDNGWGITDSRCQLIGFFPWGLGTTESSTSCQNTVLVVPSAALLCPHPLLRVGDEG